MRCPWSCALGRSPGRSSRRWRLGAFDQRHIAPFPRGLAGQIDALGEFGKRRGLDLLDHAVHVLLELAERHHLADVDGESGTGHKLSRVAQRGTLNL